MEEKLRDKARKDLVLDGLSEGGMVEELKDYTHHFNLILFSGIRRRWFIQA